jgi:hypothetical protein
VTSVNWQPVWIHRITNSVLNFILFTERHVVTDVVDIHGVGRIEKNSLGQWAKKVNVI